MDSSQTPVTVYFSAAIPNMVPFPQCEGPFHPALGPIPANAVFPFTFHSNLVAHLLEKFRLKVLPIQFPPSAALNKSQATTLLLRYQADAKLAAFDVFYPARSFLRDHFTRNLEGYGGLWNALPMDKESGEVYRHVQLVLEQFRDEVDWARGAPPSCSHAWLNGSKWRCWLGLCGSGGRLSVS